MWRRANEESSWDSVLDTLSKCKHKTDTKVVVGSDSQPLKKGVVFVTVVAFISEDRSIHGKFFYRKTLETIPFQSLYDRILRETIVSVDTASEIKKEAPYVSISVHLDVSPQGAQNKTSKFSNAMTSIVRGYGFEDVEVKPHSWCASGIADSLTKNRVRKLRNKTWPVVKGY